MGSQSRVLYEQVHFAMVLFGCKCSAHNKWRFYMNHKHYTTNGDADQSISASKSTPPPTKPSRLLHPNIYNPATTKDLSVLERYRNAPFTKIRVVRRDINDGLPVESCTKKHNHGRLNAPVSRFSPKSKRAMRQLFSKIDRVKIYEDGKGVQLMTYTFQKYKEDSEEIKRIWKNFRACFKDHYPKACFIFRWHFTPTKLNPREHPHIHVVCYGLPKMPRNSKAKKEFLKWASVTWHHCAYGDKDGEFGHANNKDHVKMGVHVTEAYSKTAIEKYISKYVSSDDAHVPEWFEGHFWGKHNPKGLAKFVILDALIIHDDLIHEEIHDLLRSDVNDDIRKSAVYANKMIVTNLSAEVDESDLKTLFSEFGNVEELKINKRKDGTSKGYGSLQMTDRSDAESAVTVLNGKTYKGNELKIKYNPTFVIDTEFFDSRTDMYGTETEGYFFSKADSNESIPSRFVDYYGGSTPIVRRAFHPVTMEFEGYLMARYKEADISKGDDPVQPPLDYWGVVKHDGTELPFKLQYSNCRFFKTTRTNKSISSSSFSRFDELEAILNQDKVIEDFLQDCADLKQQAIDFGASFKELAEEVKFPLRTLEDVLEFEGSYRVDQRSTFLTYMTNPRKLPTLEEVNMN